MTFRRRVQAWSHDASICSGPGYEVWEEGGWDDTGTIYPAHHLGDIFLADNEAAFHAKGHAFTATELRQIADQMDKLSAQMPATDDLSSVVHNSGGDK